MRYDDAVRCLMATVPGRESEGDALLSDDARFTRRANFFQRLCPAQLRRIPYYHVAGTNGKGSVCEIIRCCLHANDHRVGTFTSPHVHTIRERIRVGDRLIQRDALARCTASLESTFNENPWLLFFDKLLAVALLHFAEAGVDMLLLEVGIGGKYDSTNFFVHTAAVSIITSISYDHQALLGNTLEAIAEQKAGIIKQDGMVVCCSSMPPAVMAVIERTAKTHNAKLIVAPCACPDGCEERGFGFETWALESNVEIARAALMAKGLLFTGKEEAFWPCRFEEFLVGDEKKKIILDGAHNVDSIERLLERAQKRYPGADLHVVFGAATDKSVEAMLDTILRSGTGLILVRASHPRAASTCALWSIVRKQAEGITPVNGDETSVEEGLQLAIRTGTKAGIVIVCGSLYVAARARQWLAHEHPQLFETQDWVYESDDKWGEQTT